MLLELLEGRWGWRGRGVGCGGVERRRGKAARVHSVVVGFESGSDVARKRDRAQSGRAGIWNSM